MAGQCVSLKGSTMCPAWNQSSITTGPALSGQYPFLAFVSDAASFDTQLKSYISTNFAQLKYQIQIGCSAVDLTNTTDLYARYSASFLCNVLIQNSIADCGLTGVAAMPLCADSCASFATSEETIASSPSLCGTAGGNAMKQIRADFTDCALPADSLSANCIKGAANEPDNCGFSDNLPSLCSYCSTSSPNATDSCCLFSNTETRCQGVSLPITSAMGTIFPSATASSNVTAPITHGEKRLSGGAIAGIIVGSILGALLLLAIIIGACLLFKRRRERDSVFARSTPSRTRGPVMSYVNTTRAPDLPQGARVHQMLALEGTSSNGDHGSPMAAGYGSSSGYEDTPDTHRRLGAPKRGGSLSRSENMLDSSPDYGSSPEGMASGQSEQMSHFKDYYSNDDIRAGDTVATLWAYQPRAGDEWELERGDMLKIVGIWDDGWATGYRLTDRAEDWETRRNPNRDSGVSHGSATRTVTQLPGSGDVPKGEIKAFPLVCVCLPQHWRKTIEGDTNTVEASGSGGGSGEGESPNNTP